LSAESVTYPDLTPSSIQLTGDIPCVRPFVLLIRLLMAISIISLTGAIGDASSFFCWNTSWFHYHEQRTNPSGPHWIGEKARWTQNPISHTAYYTIFRADAGGKNEKDARGYSWFGNGRQGFVYFLGWRSGVYWPRISRIDGWVRGGTSSCSSASPIKTTDYTDWTDLVSADAQERVPPMRPQARLNHGFHGFGGSGISHAETQRDGGWLEG